VEVEGIKPSGRGLKSKPARQRLPPQYLERLGMFAKTSPSRSSFFYSSVLTSFSTPALALNTNAIPLKNAAMRSGDHPANSDISIRTSM